MMEASIVVPVKNEPKLDEFLSRLHDFLWKTCKNFEVNIVFSDEEELDNKITSRPFQRAYRNYANTLERAILLGFSVSHYDKIIVIDADGSHPVESINTILSNLSDSDMVVGSRFLENSKFTSSLFRRIVTKFFTAYAQFFGSKLSDPMSGFFGVKKSLINHIKFKPFKWKIALEIEYKAPEWAKIKEIPIKFVERKRKISSHKIKVALDLFWDILRERL